MVNALQVGLKHGSWMLLTNVATRYGEDGMRLCDAYVVAVAGKHLCHYVSSMLTQLDVANWQVDLEVERWCCFHFSLLYSYGRFVRPMLQDK
jgi:hypothetical protein